MPQAEANEPPFLRGSDTSKGAGDLTCLPLAVASGRTTVAGQCRGLTGLRCVPSADRSQPPNSTPYHTAFQVLRTSIDDRLPPPPLYGIARMKLR